MLQTFDASSSPEQGPPRLKALRDALSADGFDGFIVPRADVHQGEYVADCDARLAWLTGFTGSAGFCIILKDIAGVFVDGRYRVQVKEQIETGHFTPVDWPETKPANWIKQQATAGKIAFDPWLFTKSQIDDIEAGLAGTDVTLIPTQNYIDTIWQDRPARPDAKVEAYPIELSGKRSPDKRLQIAQELKAAGHKSAVVTLPDSICWLLNIRGNDIPRIPIVQCFAVIHEDASVDLFIDAERVADLGPDAAITQHSPSSFESVIAKFAGPVRVDAGSAPLKVSQILQDANVEVAHADDPCILPKACKNETEIEGTRTAHIRDAHAMVEFLAWLDIQAPGSLTEIDVATKLEGFRSKTNALRDISFETISGSGPNGAIVHYRVTHQSNRTVQDGELLLVDSGGQYVDGTTDITRTIAIGTPTQEQRTCFTLVLQA